MPRCILHVGAPKTGTSSIQASLHFGLHDPRFRSLHLGYPNAVDFLEPLFGDDPLNFWSFRQRGINRNRLQKIQAHASRELRRALARCHHVGAVPILSAERCWTAPASMLRRLRDYLENEGFRPHVIAYVRPLRSWLASAFQEHLKLNTLPLSPSENHLEAALDSIVKRPDFHVNERLERLDEIFGGENLTIRLFTPDALADGCVVRDFCSTLGIDFAPAAVIRANDSICGDGLRMLYCFRRYGRPPSKGSAWANKLLLMQLERLKGDPLRLHPSLLSAFDKAIAMQERQALARWGLDLHEQTPTGFNAAVICREADLFNLSGASIDWLARVSGCAPIADSEGAATAQSVAAQIEVLMRRPDPRLRWRLTRDRYRLKWRWWCQAR